MAAKKMNSNPTGFKPIDPKTADVGAMATRVGQSIDAATPSQRRGGAQWYDKAHRNAVHVAADQDPTTPQSRSRTRSGPRLSGSFEGGGYKPARDVVGQPGIDRAAGKIAALSPSMPSGMTWEKNSSAAYSAGHLNEGDLSALRTHNSLKGDARQEYGDQMKADHPTLGKTMLNHAGSDNILKAYAIHTGEKTPESALPMDIKTGSFYHNIRDPQNSQRATVDGRSHDIAIGQRLGWTTSRGLSAKGRYGVIEEAHVQAAQDRGLKPHQAQAISWVQDEQAHKGTAKRAPKRAGTSIDNA